MIDAHCHLDFAIFDEDREILMDRARALGVNGFLVAGVDPKGWTGQRALAARRSDVSIAVGLHPCFVAAASDQQIRTGLAELDTKGCVGIGEMGLDARPEFKPSLEKQKRVFRAQLALARDRDLPAVLHLVRAHGAALEIIQQDGLPKAGAMVHSFSGSTEVAARYLTLGCHISLSASVVARPVERVGALLEAIPDDRLLIETDCPDQAPYCKRPTKRNLPEWLPIVAAYLAEQVGVDVDVLAHRTASNTRLLFGEPASWS